MDARECFLAHHGILGQKWGHKNGPPYPLGASDHSAAEIKAGWRKSLAAARPSVASAIRNRIGGKKKHATHSYLTDEVKDFYEFDKYKEELANTRKRYNAAREQYMSYAKELDELSPDDPVFKDYLNIPSENNHMAQIFPNKAKENWFSDAEKKTRDGLSKADLNSFRDHRIYSSILSNYVSKVHSDFYNGEYHKAYEDHTNGVRELAFKMRTEKGELPGNTNELWKKHTNTDAQIDYIDSALHEYMDDLVKP